MPRLHAPTTGPRGRTAVSIALVLAAAAAAAAGTAGCRRHADGTAGPVSNPTPASAPATAASRSDAASPERSLVAGKPLINLKLDIEQCPYLVQVNGGIVTMDMEGNPGTDEQPINHWLRAGVNELEVFLMKPLDEPDHCRVAVTALLKNADDETAPGTPLFTLAHSAKGAAAGNPVQGSTPPGTFDSRHGLRPSKQGDLRVGPAELVRIPDSDDDVQVLKRTFEVALPLPRWAFLNPALAPGDRFKPVDAYKDRKELRPAFEEILAAYKRLWTLLQKRDVNGFLDACEERSKEIDVAFYKKPGETRAALKKQLESALGDPAFELLSIDRAPGKWWKYNPGSTGALVSLNTGAQGSPILRFEMKGDTPFSLIFPVVFRKENGRYIVTR